MNKEEVLKLAKLARIEVSDEEARRLTGEFGAILSYVGEIREVDPASREATQDESEYALKNVMREDAEPHEAGVYTEAILSQAPSREGNYFKVKKIL